MTQSVTLYQAEYAYGNLIYSVEIKREGKDFDWVTEQEVAGEFYFVEYIESTLPSKNRVGGFASLENAFEWATKNFGELNWQKII
jgi:hypothetical protein